MTPEGRVTKLIKEYLESLDDLWFMKVHGGLMQTPGVPDIIGVYYGRFFGLEIKRPGGKATAKQQQNIDKIKQAGGVACVVDDVEQVKDLMEFIKQTSGVAGAYALQPNGKVEFMGEEIIRVKRG
jgi:hypothetical protein